MKSELGLSYSEGKRVEAVSVIVTEGGVRRWQSTWVARVLRCLKSYVYTTGEDYSGTFGQFRFSFSEKAHFKTKYQGLERWSPSHGLQQESLPSVI